MLEKQMKEIFDVLKGEIELVLKMANLTKKAMETSDESLGDKILKEIEPEINKKEIDVEEICIQTAALYQPEALYLREIFMVVKMNNDLERVADHFVNICERLRFFKDPVEPNLVKKLLIMFDRASLMVKDATQSFFDRNTNMAKDVLIKDDEVDELHREIYGLLHSLGRDGKINLEQFSAFLIISRNIERVADLATNIAEDVIFAFEAKVVRHHIVDEM